MKGEIMTQIKKPNPAYKVQILEYERGWGSKIDEEIFFDNELEAIQWVVDYNKKYNTATSAPDWYMVAHYAGKVI